ncbi:MAG: 1-acyl-sn-glycerol-3-phosphate acyltransferase [Planctomycetaceae bacterium]|jgi:1-acyl-sn-glycerol-3-phosphate acyltransferase|nr:1-acyl-sn-glycerol-3-phosphate acyltransferase [Planctomycetaceae bacterium]
MTISNKGKVDNAVGNSVVSGSDHVIGIRKRLFYYLVRIPVSLFFMIFYRSRFFGCNNMPVDVGLVVAANHQSYYDPPLIAAGLRRRLNFLAKKQLFKFKPLAWLIDLLDAIPLEIDGIGFEGIKISLKRLRGNEAILIFPEGARTWDGEIGEFKKGSLNLAKKTKSAILPTAIDGCYQSWPRINKLPYPFGKIRVIYGQPLFYDDFKNLSEEELRELVKIKITELFQKIRLDKIDSVDSTDQLSDLPE